MTPATVQTAFHGQAQACIALGSPFMGQLMGLCATRDWPDCPVTDRIFTWQGDIGPRAQSVPLRLAGALHALHLSGDATLRAVYPPQTIDDTTLWTAICDTLVTQTTHINHWLDSAPQTNEVRRAAVLIAVGHFLADRYGLPIRTSELGASGGLNLHWDAYALAIGDTVFGPDNPALTLTPDWTGPLPCTTRPEIAERGGVDLNPLDPQNPKDALRLKAYLWADQPARLTLTKAAIDAAKTPVSQGDAIDWLQGRMAHQNGQTHLIYSTVAWQYFPPEKQAQGAEMIAQAGANATADTPLAWFGMENQGDPRGATLTLHLWPENQKIALGHADFHGRWVDWSAPNGQN